MNRSQMNAFMTDTGKLDQPLQFRFTLDSFYPDTRRESLSKEIRIFLEQFEVDRYRRCKIHLR